MNRRQFIQTSIIGGAAALHLDAAPTPHVNFPSNPRARLAVASYPFRKFLSPHSGTMPLLDFPKMVADRFGVPGVEPLDQHFPSTDTAYLAKFRNALHQAQSHVVNIAVGRLHGSFYDPDEAKRKVTIGNAKHWVDVAVAIGSPSIRTHIQGAKGAPQDAALAAESLKAVADYGAQKNVVIHLENDDPATEEAFFLIDIIVKANTPWLRALPDFCNSMLMNKGDDYNYKAMTELFQHAYGISHVKDSEQDGKKMYHIDLDRTFQIAKDAGYRGYFSMEYDAEGDPYEPTKHLVEASLKALK